METQIAIMDPSWFYAGVAQVTAAIVGLIGAVLGSRLIEQHKQLISKKRKINGRLLHLKNRIRDRGNTIIAMETYLDKIISYYNQHNRFPTDLKSHYSWNRSSGSSQAQPVTGWTIDTAKNDKALLPQIKGLFTPKTGKLDIKELQSWSASIEETAKSIQGEAGEAIVTNFAEDMRKAIREIKRHKAGALPSSFWWFVIAFAWLSATAIIYPLTKLRGFWENCTQQIILSCLGVGLIFLIVIFVKQSWDVLKVTDFTWDIHEDDVDEN